MQKIAVLTSGGDSPGMNAALYGIIKEAEQKNITVVGCLDGFIGIIKENFIELKEKELSKYINIGGTLLGSKRFPDFSKLDIQTKAHSILTQHGIEGLIVIGGDGSYHGALALANLHFPVIAIPGTIDNDIPLTDLTLGFHTAIENAVDAIDKISTSAYSHGHIFGVEVMGREAGDIAIWSGFATNADAIIAKKSDWDLFNVIQNIENSFEAGKRTQMYILAEGAISAEEFKRQVEKHSSFKVRTLMLGHIQRGGTPSVTDRILGIKFGQQSVRSLINGAQGKCLSVNNNTIEELDISQVLKADKGKPFIPYGLDY
ncbi:ATP-dependent 6-phosphofructokinase [Niallia nealsonii]|uniref:6-phosphofructokinase n=1 Tax=Niallia nealsonii TaxID=115979 RepID=A0A2N0Z0E8_9BACI|nr:ATP-dependent 6-phosphofructokinase [Niallia nealsonii]PKG22981.1 ATP-dependent 6-phosphofructokinase [Niallia nealsonii]